MKGKTCSRCGEIHETLDAATKCADRRYWNWVILNAYQDMGTGLTSSDQRQWLHDTRDELVREIAKVTTCARIYRTETGFIVQSVDRIDWPEVLAVAAGRNACYIDVDRYIPGRHPKITHHKVVGTAVGDNGHSVAYMGALRGVDNVIPMLAGAS